jgi:hypothetical protein
MEAKSRAKSRRGAVRKPTKQAEKKAIEGIHMSNSTVLNSRINAAVEVLFRNVNSPNKEISKHACMTAIAKELSTLGISSDDDVAGMDRFLCYGKFSEIVPTEFKGMSVRVMEAFEKLVIPPPPARLECVSESRPVGQWKDEDLVSEYGANCQQEIVDELEKRAHGMAFILFNDRDGTSVNIDRTLGFLRSARRGIHPPANFKVEKNVLKLYRAGEFPSAHMELCPIHNNVSLYESYCDCCRESWENVELNARQFIALVVKAGYTFEKRSEVTAIIELARRGLDDLAREYPEIQEMYNDLVLFSLLPQLKIRASDGVKKSDPIDVRRERGNRSF